MMKKYGNDWRKDKRPRTYRLLRTDSDDSESWIEFSEERYLAVPEVLGILQEMTIDDPHWSFEEGEECVICGEVGSVSCGDGAEEYRQNWNLLPQGIVRYSSK